MIQFLNEINCYISHDLSKVFQKFKKLPDYAINDRDLTLLEEIKFIRKMEKNYPHKLGGFPTISQLKTVDKEILFLFTKFEIYPNHDAPLLNEHLELIQTIHESGYSTQSLEKFIKYCEKTNLPHLDEFKSFLIEKSKNILSIQFFILATLFSHLDVVINKQYKHIQPICLNEIFRYRVNPITAKIQNSEVLFTNKKSKFLLPTRQFLKFLSLWKNFDSTNQKFPSTVRG